MINPEFHKWIALVVIGLIIPLLLSDKLKASIVFTLGVFILVVLDVIHIEDYLNSFSNRSVIIIFLLIFITSVVKDNFNLIGFLDRFFRGTKSERGFLFKMGFSVATLSSLMNNTPIVALLTPYVYQWGKKNNIPPSKLLMPLSFAAILGGVITVIGTSTNLVLNGFLRSMNENLLTTTDFFVPGVIVTVAGMIYFIIAYKRLLPSNTDVLSQATKNIREYLFETKIKESGKFVNKTVSEAGLRNLKGAYLAQIYRHGEFIKPIRPDEKLLANDRLYFAGDSKTVLELIDSGNGIDWAKSDKFLLGDRIKLVEVIIPRNSNLIGKSLKDSLFRERYDAAVIAIHRNGEKLKEKLGEIKFEVGDLLLLTTGKGFGAKLNDTKHLYSVSVLRDWKEKSSWKKSVFAGGSLLSILFALFGSLSFVTALLLILALSIGFRMSTIEQFKKQLNLDLLLILVGAITLGKGLIDSGAAEIIGGEMITFFKPFGKEAILLVLYMLTISLTTFVTNVAALSIVFPLTYQIVADFGMDGTPFYLAIAFAASAAFITPISYQTNLIVYGPGGYKFKDFMVFGFPLTLIYSTLILTYLIGFQL